ncbi:MAG: ribonuclease D [bacterium]|nr:ribonuclease D [bacterium]
MSQPTADSRPFELVTSPEELAAAGERWSRACVLAIDTEFVRERTFYPGLGLVQVADDDATWLVDPIALRDLTPLQAVLADRDVLKVLHSCSEDLEVLYHLFGEFPRPLFDTQIAASIAGVGHSMGYAGLVRTLFEAEIPKGETRTNWLRRPLAESQLAYAALDVAYLLPAHELLSDRLLDLERMVWAQQAVEKLADARRFLPAPETAYRRIRQFPSLSLPELARLRALCAWREEEARRRDLPRSFVVKDRVLLQLTRRPARNREALARIQGLGTATLRRHGAALLRISRSEPETEGLPHPEPLLDLKPHRRRVDELRQEVAAAAAELGVVPELLATRRLIEELMRRFLGGRRPVLPEELRDWRLEAVGRRLLQRLDNAT